MKMSTKILVICLVLILVTVSAYGQKFEPNWQSLKQNKTPQWLEKGKFGIYTHWGPTDPIPPGIPTRCIWILRERPVNTLKRNSAS